MSGNSRTAFDQLAPDYDDTFSGTWLGQYYRRRMWLLLDGLWPGGKSLLELNAGTGEDALYLAQSGNTVLATDQSREMLDQLALKLKRAAPSLPVDIRQLSLEQINSLRDEAYDGVLSNFGGLNCIADLGRFARQLGPLVKPGGTVCLCIMGPWVPWEWCWYAMHGQPGKSLRRVSGQASWRGMNIYYPTPKKVIKHMKREGFHCTAQHALGLLMPPTYASHCVANWPRTFRVLGRLEQAVAQAPLLNRFSDHFVLVFEKR